MGRFFWATAGVTALAVALGVIATAQLSPESPERLEVAFVEPEISEPEAFFIGNSGSALASAAFGLSALQPETYNGEIVLDIIGASPLEHHEKMRLATSLRAAEAGRADLHRVLSEVRVSLAVE